MGIVISNGFRYAGERVEDLLSLLGYFKHRALDAGAFALADYSADRAATLIDVSTMKLRRLEPHIEVWDRPLDAVRREAAISREYHVKHNQSDPEHDWGCGVCILPIIQGPTLIRLYAPRFKVYEPTFKLTPNVESYNYDSRSDGSPEFLPADWAKRGRAWAAAFEASRLICGNPIIIKTVDEKGPEVPLDMIVTSQPSFEARVDALASKISQMRYTDKHPTAVVSIKGTGDGLAAWKKYAGSVDGVTEMADIKRMLERTLKQRLDEADFTGDPSLAADHIAVSGARDMKRGSIS